MKRWVVFFALGACALLIWLALKPAPPPEIAFARAARARIESVLTTNGKTEPLEWTPVVAELSGRLRLAPETGATTSAGAVLAVIDSADGEASVQAAESRLLQARSELAAAESGGRPAEVALVDAALARLATEREAAAREVETLARLVDKQAATRAEWTAARDRLALVETQIHAESKRKQSLVTRKEIEALKARVAEAEAALRQAQANARKASVRAPISGVVIETGPKAGEWVEPGALLAKVGDPSRLKVTIYVDEPDLGKVRAGLPAAITWDAMPGRRWEAVVRKLPSQVVPLGTRQVGLVVAEMDNPKGELPPGANINARILSSVVEQALTVPKAALRREQGRLGVFVLAENRLQWREVETGVSSATAAEIRSGLKEGELAALPADVPLVSGMEVRPKPAGTVTSR